MKRVSIKRDIYIYLFGLLLGLTAIYALMVNQSYDVGLNESAKYSFLYEIKLTEQNYLTNGEIQPSQRESFEVFDDLKKVPQIYLTLFDWNSFQPGVIYDKYVATKDGEFGKYYYAAYQYIASKQEYLYVVSQYDEALYYELYAQSPPESVSQANSAFVITGLLFLLIFAIIRLLIHRLTHPIIQLSKWSQTLDLNEANKLQHFRYTEVQQLANQLMDSVHSQRQSIEREEFFLRAASHELRTPVSIISASSEMLTRLADAIPNSGQRAVNRINRSVVTMQNLVTSLLWMSRNQQLNVEVSNVELKEVVEQALDQHRYLSDERDLNVNLIAEEEGLSHPMPAVLVEIIVTNLIRNTFQHASKGDVEIRISPRGISISNALYELGQEKLSQDSLKQSDSEVSFGIGLILIERLCQHQNWHFTHQIKQNRFFSKVDFLTSPRL
ncbi:sensor histidine kinase [Vibrio mediterranei]|uniref:sensor histidine kinase n=1 Tax=Vibrio mediterranei TaxID=689 RepID=UPI00228395EC|nr:HAMP domain-containing sensor histidine kinase [Vibrio mediterranei]MCY9853392.1 HAMP domain-containing sensor histidine kinase [Vibrio mediterranei]